MPFEVKGWEVDRESVRIIDIYKIYLQILF